MRHTSLIRVHTPSRYVYITVFFSPLATALVAIEFSHNVHFTLDLVSMLFIPYYYYLLLEDVDAFALLLLRYIRI